MSTNENPTSAWHEQSYLSFWFSLDTTASLMFAFAAFVTVAV